MKKILASLSVALLPGLIFAQQYSNSSGGFGSFGASLGTISGYIQSLIYFVIGLAVLLFIIGLIQFVTSGGDEEKRVAARNTIIWGIIVIFVMSSVWGLVRILSSTFQLTNSTPTDLPQVPHP